MNCIISLRNAGMAAVLAVCAGCTPNVINGTVTDIRGEALPGVAVEIVGMDRQALTNPRGEYKLRYAQAETLSLAFFKTGYTPGLVELPIEGPSAKQVTPVALWPLPNVNGVFLYEDFEYIRARPVEPERYVTDATGTVYGTLTSSDVGTTNPEPLILCYKMPKYGAHLYKLATLEGRLQESGEEGDMLNVLVPVREIPIAYTAIDEPQGQLMQIQPLQPLAPDSYVVEFGVVSGENVRETRMFLFYVFDPMLAPPATEETAAEEKPEEAGEPKSSERESNPDEASADDSGGF
ncbi:MAG: hypothetical protein AMXMBFR84_03640 [Candidatus Hydrogenedentota bacterium]